MKNTHEVKKGFRVVNIEIETYDLLKDYCQKNNLKISKWVGTQIKSLILSNTKKEIWNQKTD